MEKKDRGNIKHGGEGASVIRGYGHLDVGYVSKTGIVTKGETRLVPNLGFSALNDRSSLIISSSLFLVYSCARSARVTRNRALGF